jgi:hypothetical protein
VFTLRKISLIVAIVGAAIALAACDQAKPTAAGPAPDTTTTPAPSASTSAATTSRPPAEPPKTTTAAVQSCPVTERTLLDALKGTDIADRGANPTALTKIVCYKDYAFATDNTPNRNVEHSSFLFGFKRPQNRWTPLNVGTEQVCQGHVLDQAIREHLGSAAC